MDLIYDGKAIYEVYQNECSLSYSVKEYDVEAVTSYDLKTFSEDNDLIIAGNIYKGLKWSKVNMHWAKDSVPLWYDCLLVSATEM